MVQDLQYVFIQNDAETGVNIRFHGMKQTVESMITIDLFSLVAKPSNEFGISLQGEAPLTWDSRHVSFWPVHDAGWKVGKPSEVADICPR